MLLLCMRHMRRKISYILLIAIVLSCEPPKSSETVEDNFELISLDSIYSELMAYVNKPNSNDTICLNDIRKAQNDMSNGIIVMNDRIGYDRGNKRYYNQLRTLCEQKGFSFQPEGEYCVVYEGQTQGCYGLFMDSLIYAQYGRNFKITLHEQADSLFLVEMSNDTIRRWFCLPTNPTLKKQKS